MSIQLLSVCLATLIALFKDNDIAVHVSQEDLMLLIRETATALLDQRLVPGASELDDATSTQMVRAINKTTISAASGVPRHTSLQALLSIQQQLCLEPPEDAESAAFESRMSRVITKLFARVIRHEEGLSTPFSPDVVDMEALVCMMEDTLVACQQARQGGMSVGPDAIEICRDMIRTLVQSIVRSYGSSTRLLNMMDDLGIDPDSSDLGELVFSCTEKIPASTNAEILSQKPKSDIQRENIGTLISSFIEAKEPGERQKALDALRLYKKENGKADLKAHLDQLSPAFRAFLEEQLVSLNETSPDKSAIEKASSMSERLRSLRSRIAGNDLKVQTIVPQNTASPPNSTNSHIASTTSVATNALPTTAEQKNTIAHPSISSDAIASPRHTTGIPSPASTSRSSRLTHPSPSKLPTPASVGERFGSSAQPSNSNSGQANSSRAAALRARLEAMRLQGK